MKIGDERNFIEGKQLAYKIGDLKAFKISVFWMYRQLQPGWMQMSIFYRKTGKVDGRRHRIGKLTYKSQRKKGALIG